MPFIEKFADDVLFGPEQISAASHKWQTDRASVSDYELRVLATYSRDIERSGLALRERARELASAKQTAPPPAARPTTPTSTSGRPPAYLATYTQADAAGD